MQELLTVPEPASPNYEAVLINGKSASGPGVDVGLVLRPTSDLTLGGSFGWNDLKEDADVVAYPTGAPQGVVVYPKGSRRRCRRKRPSVLRRILRFCTLGWRRCAVGRVNASVSYVLSQFYKRLVGTGVDITPGQDITIGRVGVTLDTSERWSAAVYIDNISNEQNAIFQHWTDAPSATCMSGPGRWDCSWNSRTDVPLQ